MLTYIINVHNLHTTVLSLSLSHTLVPRCVYAIKQVNWNGSVSVQTGSSAGSFFFFCKYSIELSSVVICNKSSSRPQLKFVNNVLGKNLEAIFLELYDFWLSLWIKLAKNISKAQSWRCTGVCVCGRHVCMHKCFVLGHNWWAITLMWFRGGWVSIIHSWDYACLRAGLIPPQVCGKLQWQAGRGQAGRGTGRRTGRQALFPLRRTLSQLWQTCRYEGPPAV